MTQSVERPRRKAKVPAVPRPSLVSDEQRLIGGVADWASRRQVSFGVAVDRVLSRLSDRPAPGPRAEVAAPKDCRHPVGRRIGDLCPVCMSTVKGVR